MRNPIKAIYWKVLKGPGRPRAAPSGLVPLRPLPVPTVDEKNHPEALALAPFFQGKGIDVGCGVPQGFAQLHRRGSHRARGQGGARGRREPDVRGRHSGLGGRPAHIRGDGELDYVVARHNLEHYVDVVKTLCEWRRVLKPGGVMAILVPDERAGAPQGRAVSDVAAEAGGATALRSRFSLLWA
jgi:SAM-dependent methyltransferase